MNLSYNMIKNNHRIALLLATYNGERFLGDLLDSLYAQSIQDWTLYVRDDCSTDHTLNIISEYKSRYNNIVIIDNKGINLKPKSNFMSILEQVESDFYMFVDQDDYWLPDKIKNEYEKIISITRGKDCPALVFTNMKLVDEKLNILSDSFWKSIHFNPQILQGLCEQAFIGYVTGCTMLFNKKAKEVSLPMAPYSPMHDWWVSICVYKHQGVVGYIETPQILYRKHGGNATGDFVASQSGKSLSIRWKEMLTQYRLVKACGCVKDPIEYLFTKISINKKRRRC